MDQFWVDMIMQGKAKFSDIRGEARRSRVRAILEQYVRDGKIDQEEFDEIISH